MKNNSFNIAVFFAAIKDYILIAAVAAVIITGSYFVIFSKSTSEKAESSGESTSEDSSGSASLETPVRNTNEDRKIYYPENKNQFGSNKFNPDSKVERKDIKTQSVEKGTFEKTEVKSGVPEGSAADITGTKGSYSVSETGSISGRALLEESYYHEGSTVIIRQDKVEIAVKTNEKGEFSFMMVPVGSYKLLAKAEEYYPVAKEGVKVEKNKNQKLGDIILKPDFDTAYPRITRSKPERGALDVQIPNTFGISELEAGNTNMFMAFDFSKPMDKDSVEKAVIITPVVRFSVSWVGSRRLIVKCDTLAEENPIKPNTQYKVSFKEGAVAIDGKKLVKAEPFTFTTGGMKFIGSVPADSKLHSPSNRSLEFYFNFPVDKNSVTPSNIIVYPGLKGRLLLKDNKENQISFTAEKFLPSDTAFTVTLKKDLKGGTGGTLGADVIVNFTTEPLKVMTTWPKDEEKNILTSGFPYVFFNSNVKKETVEKAISLKPDITAELVWKIDDTNIEYCIMKHKPYFNVSTEYTINIADSVVDLYDKKLKEPYKFKFKTESCRVSYMQPGEGSMNVDPKSGIKIIFNTVMNHEETEKFVSIEPKTEVVFLWSSPDNYDILNIEAKNGWEPHSSYIFRVAKVAQGKNGESLIKDFKGVIYIK
ncbi:MAG: hypothetical protein A2452_09455 [Candidatus Firestonebacteria bacterium RIFOXYC2_FULL_39_67]|nr:MAG: hypothetical protein A2536_00045 [Candidatus Firestonebacteria bacterium RIFOXYD2_FULL_39_29]OGF52467.1 MAG: hypothetical protein A2497_09380 [Candidatus Firestonebacteria bacterium RifOxyC12_full_39_7]OGF55740.1 MAG: hypothetical protein A2452_09455 [Candidatus Firestonebacteria bacterium RIFOXYC2_FULL_39_67]